MSIEKSTIPFEAVDEDYNWEICQDWFKLNILKTRGCYCFIAAVINALGISMLEARAMFDHFASHHNSVGEFDYRRASHRFQQYAKQLTSYKATYVVRKFDALLSFEQFFAISEEEQNIWIVVYRTVNCTTHSITWDSRSKRILDPDNNNITVFTYNSLASFKCDDVCEKLHTIFEKPCIFYTSFALEKEKSTSSKKEKS